MAVLIRLFGIFGVVYLQLERPGCRSYETHLGGPFGWLSDQSDGG